MTVSEHSREQFYFDALKKIRSFQTVTRLRKQAEKDWGLSFEEALEMAYENMKVIAEVALRGRRRPKK